MATISVKNLTRTFTVFDKQPGLLASIKSLFYRPERLVTAVDRVSFTIDQGELVGFIGPNGAGKTTTLKCLSGLLYPSSGHIDILGFHPSDRHPAYLRQIGFVMGQKNQLWWDIPPQETFLLNQAIYDISDDDYHQRLDFLVDILDIKDIISVPTKKLSLGQRMKCEFVAALLHQPRVLFLDEPTIGLDVVATQKIRQFIHDVNQKFKTTIILTSHNMDDVEKLCRRLILIDHGRLRYDGDLPSLTRQYTEFKLIRFSLSEPVSPRRLARYGQVTTSDNLNYSLQVATDKYLQVAAKILTTLPVSDLNIEDTPIEDIIRQIYTNNG